MTAKQFIDIVATPEVLFVAVLFVAGFYLLWRDL
jgi:hypothetical protein